MLGVHDTVKGCFLLLFGDEFQAAASPANALVRAKRKAGPRTIPCSMAQFCPAGDQRSAI